MLKSHSIAFTSAENKDASFGSRKYVFIVNEIEITNRTNEKYKTKHSLESNNVQFLYRTMLKYMYTYFYLQKTKQTEYSMVINLV